MPFIKEKVLYKNGTLDNPYHPSELVRTKRKCYLLMLESWWEQKEILSCVSVDLVNPRCCT